jgi:membrane-associated phospholipid phosphatase
MVTDSEVNTINSILAIVLIVGAYQFYFLPQKRPFRKALELTTKIDKFIPFKPGWVWIYSGLYYPVIIGLVFTINSFEKFNITAFNFLMLLFMQLVCFYVFPVQTPHSWRYFENTSCTSLRFLKLIHSFDDSTNCFPSMHVSVATLASLHIVSNLTPSLGSFAVIFYAFPVLIGLSAVYTKQHYLADVPAGAFLGYINYEIFAIYYS